MTHLQAQFVSFDKAIRLGWKEEGEILRERRDTILDQIRERLDGPSFSHFNQGSYELGTGVKPLDGDYDIDVGLRFNTTKGEWKDPVALKRRIRDALSGYNVKLRRPCVTVYFNDAGSRSITSTSTCTCPRRGAPTCSTSPSARMATRPS